MLDRRFFDVSLIVQGVANEPATNPTVGMQYIVGSEPTGDFSGATVNQLARYNGSKWVFSNVKAGTLEVLNSDTGEVMSFDGTAWETKIALALSGGSGTTGNQTAIAPVSEIIMLGDSFNPPALEDGQKFVDTGHGGIYTKNDSGYGIKPVRSLVVGDRFASTSDFKVYEYNGIDDSVLNWTITDIPIGGLFLNKADGYLYVYDGAEFKAVNAGGGSGGGETSEIITETHTLTAEEATAKSFELANSIKSGKENNVMLSVCGVVQIAGTDYTASGNAISWNDKSLADIGLQAGDVFLVQYTKS